MDKAVSMESRKVLGRRMLLVWSARTPRSRSSWHALQGAEVARLPYSSGSGGIAAALHAFLGAPMCHTLEYFETKVRLSDRLASAGWVVTGEGRLDDQTKWGKVPAYVARHARTRCYSFVGECTAEGERDFCDAAQPATGNIIAFPAQDGESPESWLRRGAREVAAAILDDERASPTVLARP